MSNDENFPPLPTRKPPDTNSMDTEQTPPTTADTDKCERMLILEESIQLQLDRLNFLELTLTRLRNGKCRKPQADFDRVTKDIDNQKNCIQQQKGELILLGSCPISDCQYHVDLNENQIIKRNEEKALKLQIILANSLSKDNVKTNVNNNDENKNKKNSRSDGFTSPPKVVKKRKILQKYSLGADAPINVENQFKALAGSSTMPDSDNAAVPVAPPRSPHPLKRYQQNYNLIMQEVARRYPKSQVQLEVVRGIP
ncbi:hypothetical protein TNCV_1091921 [Trichonephila clavipes]|nr:hypothetical protein TNCV_1091921 [Trichonephila clavipes]